MGILQPSWLGLFIFALSFVNPTSAGLVHSEEAYPTDICRDGACHCDNVEQFLISCNENTLDVLYDEEEWVHTIETNNLHNRTIEFRADSNRIVKIWRFPPMKMETLSLRENRISQIEPYALADLAGLLQLDLSHNQLNSTGLTEVAFMGVVNNPAYYKPLELQHLNLSYNLIHSIEKSVFDHLPFLETLDLSNNPLKVLGSTGFAIASLRSLRTLRMASAELKVIPDGLFQHLPNLEFLDLSGNKFEVVPPEILSTRELRVLILDNNLFESLNEESFDYLDKLQVLSISHIPTLQRIEGRTFGTLKQLKILSCHHNPRLSRLSDAAFYKIADADEDWPVKEILLNDNALPYIDDALAAWAMVEYIDIQNNPFRCDCSFKWMAQNLTREIVLKTPHLAQNITCAEPESLRGANIVALGLEDGRFSKCVPGHREPAEL